MPSIIRSNDPTEWDDIDGIYINEVTPAPSVQGQPTNVAILIAQAERGLPGLTELGGTADFYQRYGKSSSYGANLALRNKKFGRLKIARVIASDAVQASKQFSSKITFKPKQGKGVFGNGIQVKIEEASSSRQEIHTVLCVADVGAALDEKYFILRDEVGTVAFYLDIDNDGGAAPSTGADRLVEITTVASGDSASVVATKVAAAIEADSKFTASAIGATVTATCIAYAPGIGTVGNGDSGFTVTRTQLGVYAGKKYTFHDNNTGAVLPDESYDDVKIALVVSSAVFAGSLLIESTVQSTSAEPANVSFTALENGADGTVADTDYETAIALAEVERSGNVIFLDSYNDARNGYLKVHCASSPDKMAILAGPEVQTIQEVLADVLDFRDTDGRLIYAYPWIETRIDGVLTYTSPASWYASIISQTAPNVSPSFVDNARFMAGATALKVYPTVNEAKQLDAAGISSFERDNDFGFLIKNAVTTQIANSAKKTVIRRRMTDYLTTSGAVFMKNYQNAVNSKRNHKFAKSALLSFVERNEKDGILPRDSEVENGKAKLIDVVSLNSNESIGLGFFKLSWRQRIYSSMRYIVMSVEVSETVVVTEQEEE